jgi:protocatechuate 3,4-dioxygenase beta subunit
MGNALITGMMVLVLGLTASSAYAGTCAPTESDQLGPFYKAGAPIRSVVGKGYVLRGVVRSSRDCAVIAGARIELWLAGPDGEYDDDHRATIIADPKGAYRFECNEPPPYFGRPPHIHLRVSVAGFQTLVTQHYPEKGVREADFDIVLVPLQ